MLSIFANGSMMEIPLQQNIYETLDKCNEKVTDLMKNNKPYVSYYCAGYPLQLKNKTTKPTRSVIASLPDAIFLSIIKEWIMI